MKLIGSQAVFAVDDPHPILMAVPDAKHVTFKGKEIVSVPHTFHHMQMMRGFGLDAPAPIDDYSFPGKFRPYEHQTKTMRFLIENMRAYVLNGMGCIEGDAVISAHRGGKTFKISLRDLHRKYHSGQGFHEWFCRSLKGDRYGLNKIKQVIYKGVKPTLRITLADGKSFRATADHRIMIKDGGWKEAGALLVGDTLVTNGKKLYKCPSCGEYRERKSPPRSGQICRKCKSVAQQESMRGCNNPSWKGGKPFIDCDGYVRLYLPSHHRADNHGRVYEHIVVAEEHFNIVIDRSKHVHHKNGVKDDNRPENLEVCSVHDHHKTHDPYLKLDGGRTINGGTVIVLPRYSEVVSIEDGGEVDVYDLSMAAPHHNFVVNGVVVHNSGKTAATAWAADYLMEKGVVRRCLISAPLSCLERVWGDALYQMFPHRRFVVLHGTRQQRLDAMKTDWDFAVVNHHGLGIIGPHLPPDVDLLVIDELAVFRSHKAKTLWGECKKLVTPARWVWGLTGSPTPNAPTDAYALCKLLTPERYIGSFTRYKMDTMLQCGPFRWIPRANAEKIVNQVLQPSIRYALEDCIDLPETIYSERTAEMSREQQHNYLKMKRECLAEIQGVEVTAVNAAVLFTKLLQVACGVVYGGEDKVELDFGPRLEVLKEIIEEADSKVIVFVPFTGVLDALAEKLKRYWSVAVVDGGVSAGKRNQIFSDFNDKPEPHILLAHPQCMAHGLSLHKRAATTVWYAPVTSNEIYQQANARTVRPGQKKVTHIIHISASPVEEKVYKVLKEKGKFQDAVLDAVKK
jgi:hypothetical protein